MTANFALSLSFEGIRLLHRAAGAWSFVGDVSLESGDLPGDLAKLRDDAIALSPEGLRTLLILPDEQIKYLSINVDSTDPSAQRSAAAAALDGATPYSVSDLVFDLTAQGAQTFVAAVARETLDEAEAFAVEHGFDPVAFTADPAIDVFPGDPDFGPTRHAAQLAPLDIEEEAPAAPHDLSGYEVSDAEATAEAAPAQPETPEFAGSGGVVAGSLPGAEPIPAPPPPAPGSFVSRRGSNPNLRTEPPLSARPSDVRPVAEPRPSAFAPPPQTDAEGAAVVRGKPRYLGLMLTLALIVFLAGVAAWASVHYGDGTSGLSRFFKTPPAPEKQIVINELAPTPQFEDSVRDVDNIQTASLADAVPDSLRQPDVLAAPAPASGFDAAKAEAQYAVTGIWVIPPDVPRAPSVIDLDDLYVTSIDRASLSFDAVALVPGQSFLNDEAILSPANPAPQGTQFTLDARGLVLPTPEGTMSPDGVLVHLGRPALVPPAVLTRPEAEPEPLTQVNPELAKIRPRARPENLVENTERIQLGGLSRSELAQLRPRLRPETEKAAAEVDETPTAQAVAVSFRPALRPGNFDRVVADARASTTEPDPAPREVAAVAPRTVTPSVPSGQTVSRQATIKDAIKLNRINLMGVYGTASDRRALVRLSNGRYKKVKVGDRIDGGRVSAIGEGELRYKKGNRNIVLKMPKT